LLTKSRPSPAPLEIIPESNNKADDQAHLDPPGISPTTTGMAATPPRPPHDPDRVDAGTTCFDLPEWTILLLAMFFTRALFHDLCEDIKPDSFITDMTSLRYNTRRWKGLGHTCRTGTYDDLTEKSIAIAFPLIMMQLRMTLRMFRIKKVYRPSPPTWNGTRRISNLVRNTSDFDVSFTQCTRAT
jgi:hypothetical protein